VQFCAQQLDQVLVLSQRLRAIALPRVRPYQLALRRLQVTVLRDGFVRARM